MRKGDIITLPAGSITWRRTTPEQLAGWVEADRLSGRVHDDAGEPILYPRGTSHRLEEDTIVLVTGCRNVPWHSSSRRPPGLTAGRTADGVEIVFCRGAKVTPVR